MNKLEREEKIDLYMAMLIGITIVITLVGFFIALLAYPPGEQKPVTLSKEKFIDCIRKEDFNNDLIVKCSSQTKRGN